MKGRRWVLNRAQSVDRAGTKPTDHDIPDLHAAMFGDFLDWAGTTRRDDRGPGGRKNAADFGAASISRPGLAALLASDDARFEGAPDFNH